MSESESRDSSLCQEDIQAIKKEPTNSRRQTAGLEDRRGALRHTSSSVETRDALIIISRGIAVGLPS